MISAEMQHITYTEFLPAVLVFINMYFNLFLWLRILVLPAMNREAPRWQVMDSIMRIVSLSEWSELSALNLSSPKSLLFKSIKIDLSKYKSAASRDSVDPGILNSFATAAYRFGHSLVQSIFRLRSKWTIF